MAAAYVSLGRENVEFSTISMELDLLHSCASIGGLMRRTLFRSRPVVGFLATAFLATGILACSDLDQPPYFNPGGPDPRITVTAEPPPAISGGTLLIARDGHTAVAADPDRDRVWVVDLEGGEPSSIAFEHGDEPGRVVEDAAGRVHVALRRAGSVATIDVGARTVLERRAVCAAPRGLAYDASLDAVHVACAGGELVTLPAAGGAALRKLRVAPDLRDLVIDGDRLLISRFKSAETLVVGSDGTVLSRRSLPSFTPSSATYEPSVAWRMTALRGGGAAMVHQRSTSSKVVLSPGGYYQAADCDGGIVHGAISIIEPASVVEPADAARPFATIPNVALPLDIAAAPDGQSMAIVAAGNDKVVLTTVDTVNGEAGRTDCFPPVNEVPLGGQPIAVAFDPSSRAVVQLREPAAIQVIGGPSIELPGESVRDTGHEMFHRPPNGINAIACASCHPEGHEDGHTWDFDPVGFRRTQAVGGGVLKTAPLHWSGDQADLSHLMSEVFVGRMGGPQPGKRRIDLMGRFIERIPAFPASPPDDPAAVARGQALFSDRQVGCADCHSGEMFTNNLNKDVGTGELFQVPSLIGVSGRAPFMHDGCAATLRDRFDPACGGSKHGNVSALSTAQLDDLVTYLESL
jgi:mono/diheme cytochrome c family protein